MSNLNRPTSDQITDGKVEKDKDGVVREYKLIKGGYEIKTTTPQPNGTKKIQVQTFWDPMPEEELQKVIAEHNQANKKPHGTIERIDKNTTVEYRDIEGGHEEITTIIQEDGTKSIKKRTFYDAKVSDGTDDYPHPAQKDNKKTVTKKDTKAVVEAKNKKVLKKTDSTDSQSSTHVQQETVEEYRKVTQTSAKTTRKNSTQQAIDQTDDVPAIEAPKEKPKKKKTKGAPAPPPDFIENDSTTVKSKKVPGGTEYTYTSVLEDGRTIETIKTVYEEEDVEMTEEEISQYKKELKDAQKHKDITTAKKLKSPSGTKKVLPPDENGAVTTVETFKYETYTEFHYTIVASDGVVSHKTKTVFDAVQAESDEDEMVEVEEIEEEVIEPGETITKTFESTKVVEKAYAETVVTKKGKKTKKIVTAE